MRTPFTRHRTVVLAALGLLPLLALAAAPSTEASIVNACVKKKGGAVHIVKKAARCKRGETKVSWANGGPAGRNGASGAAGAVGVAGAVGAYGANGVAGATGPAGASTETGASGATGVKGSSGATGPAGATGETGAAGATGTKGATGPSGPAGATGETGAGGATGATGTSGAVGGYSVAQSNGVAVAFTSGTDVSPKTIVSRTLPAGTYIVNGKVELQVSDTKEQGEASVACKLVDTPSEAGTTASDTSGWTTAINVLFGSLSLVQTTVALTLAVNSSAHPSTIAIVCYAPLEVAHGGTLIAVANDAVITAVQTTLNS
jgi:hypothetical protein